MPLTAPLVCPEATTLASYRRRLCMLMLILGAVMLLGPSFARAQATLNNFTWKANGDALEFTLSLAGRPTQLTQHDLLVTKRYLYFDFAGVAKPAKPNLAWDIAGSSSIHHVKQLYYEQAGVLRFIFYARPGVSLRHAMTQPEPGVFRLRVSPVNLLPLSQTNQTLGGSRKLVVLDPGHGGKKSLGAQTSNRIGGRTYFEKDLVLQISRRLERLMRQAPNIDVVMTRSDDTYVSLSQRVRDAEASEGDLFLSIHLNAQSNRRKTARGFEIYYLSDGSKQVNRTLVALENDEGIEMDKDEMVGPGGLADLLRHLSDEKFQQRQAESRHLCEMIHAEFLDAGPFRRWDRGVKSAPFRVLMNYNMPAALVECGFIDHDAEARELLKPEVQDEIAALLFNGINRYFASVDPEFVPHGVAVGK